MVALPMRKTAYSSKLMGPLRAPTIRSVPERVLAKPSRTSPRSRSTPISKVTLSAIDRIVSRAVKRRLRRLFQARARIGIVVYPRGSGAQAKAAGDRRD